MRNYLDALALARDGAPSVTFTRAGRGTNGRVSFDLDGNTVAASIHGNTVASFAPDAVALFTCGWSTPTTFDAIAAALDVHRQDVRSIDRVPYALGRRMSEGMRVKYPRGRAGRNYARLHIGSLDLNAELSPLADPRGANLIITDVSRDRAGLRVTIQDWTYDGKDHTPTARKLAAAHVGHPGAATSVVNRFNYPTSEPNVTILVKVAK